MTYAPLTRSAHATRLALVLSTCAAVSSGLGCRRIVASMERADAGAIGPVPSVEGASTAASASVAARPGPPPLDATTVRACNLTYACALSHPGLGSSSQSTSVDFAACTKTVSSSSGPFESDPVPLFTGDGGNGARRASSKTTMIGKAACEDLQRRVVALRPEVARTEQESAQVDTAACAVTVYCPSHPEGAVLSVQRQSLTGSGPVVALIRALYAAQ